MQETIYAIQPSFSTGEISPEVSSRVDLDKYQSSLLNAENAYIRPYGAVYKRGGSKYIGKAKYGDKRVKLVAFPVSESDSVLLEIGHKYINVWDKEEKINLTIDTPYEEELLDSLRFCQSADVLYITSGKYPVHTLSRYSNEKWEFKPYEFISQYFDNSLESVLSKGYEVKYDKEGTYRFQCQATGNYTITIYGAGGGGGGNSYWNSLEATAYGGNGGRGGYLTKTIRLEKGTYYPIVVGKGGKAGDWGGRKEDGQTWKPKAKDGQDGEITTAFGESIAGGKGGKKSSFLQYIGTNGQDGESVGNGNLGGKGDKDGQDGAVYIVNNEKTMLTPSNTYGEITLTANKEFFTDDMKGMQLQLIHDIPSVTVTQKGEGTSKEVLVGKGWKVVTHGKWKGEIKLQKQQLGGAWKDFRSYKSDEDFNASESGTVDEPVNLRVVATSGDADLTSLPYTHKGLIEILEINSSTKATCKVLERLGSTKEIDTYTIGSWNNRFGYPLSVCFFQDRLCFGGTYKQPYIVWMSRTGDYANFSVEKVSGSITDDSAISLSFISRNQQAIKHLVPCTDLCILTTGNEWTISGSSTVKPTEVTPKVQTSRGCNDVTPLVVGGRVIYVQKRGETVRDMAYTFESDSYDGMDLTLLAKHLTRGKNIVDGAYMQSPDSRLYFVLDDGSIACLAYIQDQKVYAWSHLKTDGKYISVANVEEDDEDFVYTVVERVINGEKQMYIEKLEGMHETNNPSGYTMLDSSQVVNGIPENGQTICNASWLRGKKITALVNGRTIKNIQVDSDGNFTLQGEIKSSFLVGLPYTMKVALTNIEIAADKKGTLQGRKKKISGATLRLINSLGGKVGVEENKLDPIKYDELSNQEVTLYSGDKHVTMPNTGFEINGRVYIESDEPYPFTLMAIIREMVMYG